LSQVRVEPYCFPDEKDLIIEEHLAAAEQELEEDFDTVAAEEEAESQAEEEPKQEQPVSHLDYAQVQSDQLLREARRRADEILDRAEQEAEAKSKSICDAAREEGYRDGYAKGAAQAEQELLRQRVAQATELGDQVQKFLEQAADKVDRQMDEQVDDLRDLAMAVAEKIVGVSLKSSSDVICRMIQAAIEKKKHKEWVRIYIAECDAKRMTQVPASLASALAALSDRVRIVPVAGDEPGTCIIEMPDEIVDASAETQLNNIRGIVMNAPSVGPAVNII
jgi:flagellar assembly protein FliH